MTEGYQALTDKEKQTLRLLVCGYDAKSVARHLGLSIHTVNERLRDARRKMAVSSSREAARMLFDQEGGSVHSPTNFSADKQFGDAEAGVGLRQQATPNGGHRGENRPAWVIGGVVMSLTFTMLALSPLSQVVAPTAGEPEAAPTAIAESEALRSARNWLALVDQGRWNESWEATGQAFKQLNTNRKWTSVSEMVRPSLGAVVSRTASSQQRLPAPPGSYEVIKFRTSFANKPSTAETVTLFREDQTWKVVAYLIG